MGWKTSVTILAVLLGGCSFDPPPDVAGPDASTRGRVTATVRALELGEAPVEGAAVLFHDPDGTLIAHETTDAMGRAEAELLPGGSVTVVDAISDPTATLLRTIFAVEPGDNLAFGPVRAQRGESVGTMNIQLEGTTAPAHRIFNGCPSTFVEGTSAAVEFFDHCRRATFDLHVLALDADGVETAHARVEDVSFASDGTIVVPDNWNSVTPYQVTVEGIPASSTSASMVMRLLEDGYPVAVSVRGGAPDVGAFAATGGYPVLPNGPDPVVHVVSVGFTAETESQLVIETRTGPSPTWAFDAGALLLPRLGDAAFDPDAARISWTETGGTPDHDGASVALGYRSDAGKPHRWILWSPPGAAAVVLPSLPGELLAEIATLDSAFIDVFDADTVDGFAAIRAAIDAQSYDLLTGGTPGTVRRSYTLITP